MTARLALEDSRLVNLYVSDVLLRAEVDATKPQMHDYMQVKAKHRPFGGGGRPALA